MAPHGISSGQCYLAVGALAALGAITVGLQFPGPLNAQSTSNATYTAEQASAGRTAYSQSCASCHGPNIDDGEFAPPLKGAAFMQKYGGKPVSELITYITSKMPPSNPGRLGAAAYTQIAAFILQQNGASPGDAELPADAAQLSRLIIPGSTAPRGRGPGAGPGGGLTPGVKLPPPPAKPNPLDRITPVSDAMLKIRRPATD